MRHLVVIVAVIYAVIGDGWAQNRGSVRYVPPEDFEDEITRAPRPAPTRGAAVRRQRPTKVPEPAAVDDELKAYQPPESPVRTTARRVPQKVSPQHVAPPTPSPLPVEDAASRYASPIEPQVPPTGPEGKPQGTRRRRPKKRRRPQNAVPKEVGEPDKPIIRGEEKTSISELLNEDKKRSEVFPNSPVSRNNPSTYIPDPIYQPEKSSFESNPPSEQQNNAAGTSNQERGRQEYVFEQSQKPSLRQRPQYQEANRENPPNYQPQYYRPQQATNRLPVGDPEPIGNSRGYLESSQNVPENDGPASYVPKGPAASVPNDASYVPILSPIRVPSDGASPQSDDSTVPIRSHSEVRLPENEQPHLSSEYVPPSFDSTEDQSIPNAKVSEENKPPSASNRLPNPSEIHYDSVYPDYSDYTRNSQRSAGRRQEPEEPSVRNPLPSYTTPRRDSGTKPHEFDNDAEVDRQQVSQYRPPLQRTGSRYKSENSEEPTLSRTPDPSPSTAVPRTRGSTRYQPPEPQHVPERTRSSTRTRSDPPVDSPSRARNSATPQSTTRTRTPQRYAPETVGSVPRTSSRRQTANTEDITRDNPSAGYVPIDELTENPKSPSHSPRTGQPLNEMTNRELREHGNIRNTIRYHSPRTGQPSNEKTHSELQEYGTVRNTLRSRPQYEVTEAEHSYEESVEDDVYNPDYQLPRQTNTRGQTTQRTSVPIQHPPPQPEYQLSPNQERGRQEYIYEQSQNPKFNNPNEERSRQENIFEQSQKPSLRQRPQYQAPQNPRPNFRQAANRENPPNSRPQGRTRHQNSEPSPPPRRPSGGTNFKCPDAFGFFADPVQCDKYYECRNGTAEMNLCHDGLAFNDNSAPNFLRCDSLRDVDCKSRPELQEAQPTKNCPRKYGLFPHETDCTKFWNCVDGVATEVQCPPGLTYNDERATCDWADLVESSCKSEDLLGFTCPEPTAHDLVDGVFSRYPHPDNCQLHFICIKGADGLRRPRMLSCTDGRVFDPATASCNRPEEVPGCEDFYGPPPKRKPARQPEPEPEEIEEPTPRPRRRGSNQRARN